MAFGRLKSKFDPVADPRVNGTPPIMPNAADDAARMGALLSLPPALLPPALNGGAGGTGVVGMNQAPQAEMGHGFPAIQAALAPPAERPVMPSPLMPQPPQAQPPLAQPATEQKPHPKFFDHDGAWRDVVGISGDVLGSLAGLAPTYAANKQRARENERKDTLLKIQLDREARAERKPTYLTVPNVGVVAIDPTNNATTTLIGAKSAGQAYAESLGLHPGDKDYNTAIANFALRGNGPDAISARADLQDDRQASAVDSMRERVALQQSLADHKEGLRRSRPVTPHAGRAPTPSTVMGSILAKMASGQSLNPSETTLYQAYAQRGRGGGRGSGHPPAAAPRYRNAQGHTIAWDGTKWAETN